MSEVLLQTIVEKLEALQIALLKKRNAGKDETMQKQILQVFQSFQSEVIKLTSHLNTNYETLHDSSKEISVLRLNLNHPKQNQVKHTQHFHKQVWITVSLLLIYY